MNAVLCVRVACLRGMTRVLRTACLAVLRRSHPSTTMACAAGGCAAAVPSGSEAYAKLYPEKSSDGGFRLGNVCPGERGPSTGRHCRLAVRVSSLTPLLLHPPHRLHG